MNLRNVEHDISLTALVADIVKISVTSLRFSDILTVFEMNLMMK